MSAKPKKKIFKKLKKSKLFRGVGNFVVGLLNGNPVTAPFTPSVQDFNEQIDQADLNGDGKIGKVARKELITYYIVNNLGVILSFGLILFGLLRGLDKETIEWAVKLFQSSF